MGLEVIVVGVIALVAAGFAVYYAGQVSQQRNKAAELANDKHKLEEQVKTLGDKLSVAKPKIKKLEAAQGGTQDDKKSDKKKIKSLQDEIKALRSKVKDESKSAAAPASLDLEMREQLAEAKNLAEEMRHRAVTAEAELTNLRGALEEDVEEAGDDGLSKEQAEALKIAHRSEFNELNSENKEFMREIQNQHKGELRMTRDKLQSELRELRDLSRRNSREAEQQRRRATNNDKAYKIVQLQLDAALEKLALIDPDTEAPGGFYDPVLEEKLQREADEKRRAEKAAREIKNRAAKEAAQQAAAAAAFAVAAEATPEPIVEATSEPIVEAAPEPAAEPAVEATPEPAVEAAAEPAAEATPEPAAEAAPEPAVEAAPEAAAEPAAEATPEPAAEATPEPAAVAAEDLPDFSNIDLTGLGGDDTGVDLDDGWSLDGPVALPELEDGKA